MIIKIKPSLLPVCNAGSFSIVNIIIVLLLVSCAQDKRVYFPPQPLNDNWEVSMPGKEGVDPELIQQAISKISRDYKNIDGLVIAKNGKLIVDEYFNGYNAEKLHKIWSVTKPVTGALIGMAIDRGLIKSENDSIYSYLGAYAENVNPLIKNITLRHLLTMTSGIDWVELGGPNSAGYKVAYAKDWIRFVLNQPVNNFPGTTFNYSTGNALLLAPVIKNTTGKQADEFAEEFLFAPLGITNYEWVKQAGFWTKLEDGELPSASKPATAIKYEEPFSRYPHTGAGLKMRPRDMAKFGQLYLNKGQWAGKQIISRQWIEESAQPHFNNKAYGYFWRLSEYNLDGKKINCIYATGFGLQSIYVFPEVNLVIVFTQQNYSSMPKGEEQTQDIISNYILRAIREY